jgi:acetyl-CoA synthetase (ADP-forming)
MLLNQKQAQDLLKKYSLRFPDTLIFHGFEEVSGRKITSPCVLKVDSPDAVHKTELGLVSTGINNIDDLRQQIGKMQAVLTERQIVNYNFILQETVVGTEFLIGMKTDAAFGKVIVFGVGGIFVELFKDVSMRIAPLEKKDCIEMLGEIKAKKILDGYRRFPPVNKDRLIDVLMKISRLAMDEKDIIEIDFNPVIANEKEAVIVDARMMSDKDA